MRDDAWLKSFLEEIWNKSFPDIKKKNKVLINWKGKWKNKFGHIKRIGKDSTEIGINSNFKNNDIPEYIVELTIAHEIVHYMHGFNSPYSKLFNHPHKGGIVNKELKKRGYSNYIKLERKWFKNEWISMHNLNENGKIKIKQLRSSFRFF